MGAQAGSGHRQRCSGRARRVLQPPGAGMVPGHMPQGGGSAKGRVLSPLVTVVLTHAGSLSREDSPGRVSGWEG